MKYRLLALIVLGVCLGLALSQTRLQSTQKELTYADNVNAAVAQASSNFESASVYHIGSREVIIVPVREEPDANYKAQLTKYFQELGRRDLKKRVDVVFYNSPRTIFGSTYEAARTSLNFGGLLLVAGFAMSFISWFMSRMTAPANRRADAVASNAQSDARSDSRSEATLSSFFSTDEETPMTQALRAEMAAGASAFTPETYPTAMQSVMAAAATISNAPPFALVSASEPATKNGSQDTTPTAVEIEEDPSDIVITLEDIPMPYYSTPAPAMFAGSISEEIIVDDHAIESEGQLHDNSYPSQATGTMDAVAAESDDEDSWSMSVASAHHTAPAALDEDWIEEETAALNTTAEFAATAPLTEVSAAPVSVADDVEARPRVTNALVVLPPKARKPRSNKIKAAMRSIGYVIGTPARLVAEMNQERAKARDRAEVEERLAAFHEQSAKAESKNLRREVSDLNKRMNGLKLTWVDTAAGTKTKKAESLDFIENETFTISETATASTSKAAAAKAKTKREKARDNEI